MPTTWRTSVLSQDKAALARVSKQSSKPLVEAPGAWDIRRYPLNLSAVIALGRLDHNSLVGTVNRLREEMDAKGLPYSIQVRRYQDHGLQILMLVREGK